jgi:NAD(P)H dehydrogenase (quinone)
VSNPPKIAVIYYSATGTVYELAQSILTGAEDTGAEVRLLKVAELAPQAAIAANPAWQAHAAATQHVPTATPDDIRWTDAVIFGSPTRFGNVASQLKQFLDTLGGLWAQGELADKVYSGFTASTTAHGGQESTLLALYNSIHHFGGILVAPGYTDPIKYADGNPYGTSHVSGQGPVDDTIRAAAAYQGRRVAVLTAALKARTIADPAEPQTAEPTPEGVR